MSKKLSLVELTKSEIRKVSGGQVVSENCWCACWWAGTPNGSSTSDNARYNDRDGLSSPVNNPT